MFWPLRPPWHPSPETPARYGDRMFMMRPATGSDQDQIATMIRLRATWMKSRGLYGADGWGSKAESLAGQAGDTGFPVWVCVGGDGRVAGCTSLYTELPEWGWTPQEQKTAVRVPRDDRHSPCLRGATPRRADCLVDAGLRQPQRLSVRTQRVRGQGTHGILPRHPGLGTHP